MRWPIRHQILLPFVAVVLLAVTALTAAAALLAARRTEQLTLSQLQTTVDTLGQSSFPLTAPVLERMRGLSGAHFLGCDAAGVVVASTLPAGSRPREDLAEMPIGGNLAPLAAQPMVQIDGTRYFAARMRPRGNTSVQSLIVLYPVERWSRDQWDAARLPLMVGGPALLLTSLVALWLAQRFSGRLRRLQTQVAAIAAGDFCEIEPGHRRDEIHELVTSVNQMAAQLRQQQRTIRQSERTRLLSQLAGGLAHQLRNAVAGARMALQLHQRRCAPNPGDQSLSVALRQLSLIEAQVRGMLSLGRGERRSPTVCDVGRLASDVEPLLQPSCEHVGVALTIKTEDAHAHLVLADVEGLRAALLNLALNAIEAAGSGGAIRLAVSSAVGEVTMDVSDTGPGPSSEVAESLFEPFVTGKPEGVGLGLALARQIALDHGGTLAWFRENERTVFRLTLPSAREVANTASVGSEKQFPESRILNSESLTV